MHRPWFLAICRVQPLRLLLEFGAPGPVTVCAMSVTPPFTIPDGWPVLLCFRSILRVIVTEPTSIEPRPSRRTLFAQRKPTLLVSGYALKRGFSRVSVSDVISAFPSVEFAVASWFPFRVFRTKSATWTSTVPIFFVATSVGKCTYFSIAFVKISVTWFSAEKFLPEIKTIVLGFIRVLES